MTVPLLLLYPASTVVLWTPLTGCTAGVNGSSCTWNKAITGKGRNRGVEGGTWTVEGGTVVVEGRTGVIEGGTRVVESGTGVVEDGTGEVEGLLYQLYCNI